MAPDKSVSWLNIGVSTRAAPTAPTGWAQTSRSAKISLVVVSFIDIIVFVLGIAGTFSSRIGEAGTAVALSSIGVTTFVGFFIVTDDMRTAIAASFVTLYFATLPVLLIDRTIRDIVEKSDFARSVITQFTTLVGTVVAFYLGATAIVDRTRIQEAGKTARATQPPGPASVSPGATEASVTVDSGASP